MPENYILFGLTVVIAVISALVMMMIGLATHHFNSKMAALIDALKADKDDIRERLESCKQDVIERVQDIKARVTALENNK